MAHGAVLIPNETLFPLPDKSGMSWHAHMALFLALLKGTYSKSGLLLPASSLSQPRSSAMDEAIKAMDGTTGYDAVIVCTSNIGQEKYWQGRLEATLGQAAKEGALILAVHEDWGKDGAGNGLGTLYAYTKARAKAKELGVDLDEKLQVPSSTTPLLLSSSTTLCNKQSNPRQQSCRTSC